MAYQQTNATSVEDLINKIATFAAANGWTVRRNNLVTTSRTVTLQKSGDNIHVWNTATNAIRLRGSVGYDGELTPDNQPLKAVSEANCNLTNTGPYGNVFLFASGTPAEYIHVVIEIAGGIFRHLSFGELVKSGSFTGGTYFDAISWNTSTNFANDWSNSFHHRLFDGYSLSNGNRGGVRCDVDGNANYFAPFALPSAYATPTASGGMHTNGLITNADQSSRNVDGFYSRSINTWSGINSIKGVRIRVYRGSGYHSEIGEVPGMRFLNMSRLQVGDEFTIGPDTWKVFPWIRKGSGPITDQYSLEFAFCYLKTV